MPLPKLSKLELQIMDALWRRGPCSVREIQESFPAKKRPAYTTVQTMVYRLEVKKALRRVKKIATANIFEAAVSRDAAAVTPPRISSGDRSRGCARAGSGLLRQPG